MKKGKAIFAKVNSDNLSCEESRRVIIALATTTT